MALLSNVKRFCNIICRINKFLYKKKASTAFAHVHLVH